AVMFTAPVPAGIALNSAPDQLRVVSRDPSLWQLSLTHQSGSLENVVAAIRRRNLLVSFGVLLLLAISMALVLVVTLRARRLAAQQMEFIAGVSHELRTPVSVVCMASANLADGMVRSDKQVRQYGTMINAEGRRLSEMVEQVLDLAGTESVRNPYHLVPISVEEPVNRAVAALRNQAGNKNITLEADLSENLPLVLADHRAIERAVYNLLSNAMKYSPDDCWIKISVDSAKDQMLEISVTDRGLGIDPSDKPHIFKQFRRGKNALLANIPGNGLGLCLVDRIMKAHGGQIVVESVLGQGSTFTLRLPVAQQSFENIAEQVKEREYEQTSIVN
ncbi:MAG TPA: HAMP domain-containing sensor histidine kinase, partial [Blastocatellia bacterium]|nr:HAMP domain-containing sensor histidine kinase [Blastocatellia bacterium]